MDIVTAEMSSSRSRQFERFEMMKRSGSGTSSEFVNERVGTRLTAMVRERYEGEPDAELRAQLAAGVLSTVMSIATQEWLSKGCHGDMEDEARHCFDLVRTLLARFNVE